MPKDSRVRRLDIYDNPTNEPNLRHLEPHLEFADIERFEPLRQDAIDKQRRRQHPIERVGDRPPQWRIPGGRLLGGDLIKTVFLDAGFCLRRGQSVLIRTH